MFKIFSFSIQRENKGRRVVEACPALCPDRCMPNAHRRTGGWWRHVQHCALMDVCQTHIGGQVHHLGRAGGGVACNWSDCDGRLRALTQGCAQQASRHRGMHGGCNDTRACTAGATTQGHARGCNHTRTSTAGATPLGHAQRVQPRKGMHIGCNVTG